MVLLKCFDYILSPSQRECDCQEKTRSSLRNVKGTVYIAPTREQPTPLDFFRNLSQWLADQGVSVLTFNVITLKYIVAVFESTIKRDAAVKKLSKRTFAYNEVSVPLRITKFGDLREGRGSTWLVDIGLLGSASHLSAALSALDFLGFTIYQVSRAGIPTSEFLCAWSSLVPFQQHLKVGGRDRLVTEEGRRCVLCRFESHLGVECSLSGHADASRPARAGQLIQQFETMNKNSSRRRRAAVEQLGSIGVCFLLPLNRTCSF